MKKILDFVSCMIFNLNMNFSPIKVLSTTWCLHPKWKRLLGNHYETLEIFIKWYIAGLEVPTVLLLESSTYSHPMFRETCPLQLHSLRLRQARNHCEAGSKQRLAFNRLHSIISQKIELLINTLYVNCCREIKISLLWCYTNISKEAAALVFFPEDGAAYSS
jgi:hypothetical protein